MVLTRNEQQNLQTITLQTIIHYIVLEKILVISDLKTDLVGVMEWFKINSLKANRGKFQFRVLGNKDKRSFDIHISNVKIKLKRSNITGNKS